MTKDISEPITGEYEAINFDGLERRANYRTIAYREDILHILERKDAAAIIYQIISRWETEIKRPQIIKEIERRRQTKQPPLTAQEVEDTMWVYMSYNDFVRESGGAVGYNTVIRMLDYMIDTKKVVEQRENHDPRYPDYEYRINRSVVKELLKALPAEPVFTPKVPKKKEKSTQEGIGLDDSTQMGIPPYDSTQVGTDSTQEGIATTQMGTEVYPNGGTSHITTHNYSHNYNTERERIPAPESDATFSPPFVGDARAFSSSGEIDEAMIREVIAQSSLSSEGEITEEFIQRTIDAFKQSVLVELRARPGLSEHPDDQLPGKRENETPSQQGGTDALLDTAGRLPAVGDPDSGMERSGEDIRPLALQQPEGQDEIDNTFSEKENLPTSAPAQPTELLSVPLLPQEVKAEQAAPGTRAQQNHGAGSPCGAVVAPDVPPSGVLPTAKGKGKKQTEPAPKCDTKEIQRRIDEHRGYSLEERVEIIRERGAVKTWCNLHTLEEYTLVMDGLKNDPYWGKAENYYRVGGLTLLKETGRVLALKATQYKPALKVVKRYSSYDDPNFRSDQDFYPVEGGSYAAASY